MNLDFVIANSFGVVRTAQLNRCGVDRDEIGRLVAMNRLRRVRHGWLASDSPAPAALAAVKGGGVLSCVSALALRGYWTPRVTDTHVRLTDFGRRSAAGGLATGLRRCGSRAGSKRPASSVDPTLIALSAAAGCVSDEELVAIIDSILHAKRVSEEDVRAALAGHPAKVRRLLDRVDGRAESGSESIARAWWRGSGSRCGHRYESPVWAAST
ncbi:type IV toxin-antitoxin system AbiEi family antitoxin domain-containing protein [Cumulibacter manganitolerans]|uniref:type IV toxin-antitoxin system AbiEi family antitoxin domain-containing protein n=1 Tax=Cumulibacter manganitolerans TaxID=1884992 RepID=UPI001296B868|nr:type IV toxin-antitoxin system AbiEi family antitoxin domain-containing protein [Cumulibacter manganitolerans]